MKMSKRWRELCWDKGRWITGLADGKGAGSQTVNKKQVINLGKLSSTMLNTISSPFSPRKEAVLAEGCAVPSPRGAVMLQPQPLQMASKVIVWIQVLQDSQNPSWHMDKAALHTKGERNCFFLEGLSIHLSQPNSGKRHLVSFAAERRISSSLAAAH